MFEFLFFGTVWFWLLISTMTVLTIFFVDDEKSFWSFVTLASLVTVTTLSLPDHNPATWALHHPLGTLGYLVAYFAAGSVWGFVKWFFFCQKIAQNFKEFMAKDKTMSYDENFKRYRYAYGKSFPPVANENSGRIVHWIAYWPFSAFWTLINDPVRKAARWLYTHLFAGTYQKISDFVFKDLVEVK